MKQTLQIDRKTIRCDFGFILILIVMFLTSCFAIYNSFNLIRNGSGSSYLRRQIMWYGIGFATLILISRFQNKALYRYIPDVYKYLVYVLVYLLASKLLYRFTGHSLPFASPVNGAYSWLQIPGIGSFQASEFMKVVLILKTSLIISDFQKKHPHPSFKNDLQMFWEIAKWAVPPMVLILLEPDTGLFIIIGFTLLVLILCSGVRPVYIWVILGFLVLLFGGFFYLYFYQHDLLSSIVSDYQLRRIDAWLYPEHNILGSSNQLYTALLSLGSAGLTGHGLQANIIAIPEAHTDFIFAAFGQCFGLLGTMFILAICTWLDLYLCKMAYNSRNTANRLIIIGTIAMLLYQQIQNLGMIVGLVPITGITLPLISYGGSSTLSYFILFGLIMNLSPLSSRIVRIHIRPKKMIHTVSSWFQTKKI
ncbi:FtsW/RodA/SpoVE family cell cycle protein [Erysipelotrichaceae bacterium 51-3]